MDLTQRYEMNSPSTISDEVAGETLAINLATGEYLVMGVTSGQLWAALSSGVAPRDLLDGSDDPRVDALERFLAKLLDGGLLRVSDAAPTTAAAPQWASEDLVWQEHQDLAELLVMDLIHDADENVGWPMRRSE